jgi:type II secretory pathway pseudopilin PulG
MIETIMVVVLVAVLAVNVLAQVSPSFRRWMYRK